MPATITTTEINSTRFDIAATFPGGATEEQFPQMMQRLLRDRFKLQSHMESRESPVFTLEVARGGLKILIATLGRFLDRPILDQTKLGDARFDVTFPIAQEDYMPMLIRSAVNAGITLPPQAMALLDAPSIGSVEAGLKSLGLSLQAQKAPLDLLVVDSIERMPTEN